MNDWKSLLETRRQLLLAAATRHGPLQCVLIHVGPGERDRLQSLPRQYRGMVLTYQYGDPAGGEWHIRLQDKPGWTEFQQLAQEAGKVLREAPADAWSLPPEVLQARYDAARWVQVLFHLAAPPRRTWDASGVYYEIEPWAVATLRDGITLFDTGAEELRVWLETLPDFWLQELPDVWLASVDVIGRLMGVDEKPAPPAPSSDGPVTPNRFAWGGKIYDGLAGKPWPLVNCLWSAPQRSKPFEELALPVWGDASEQLTTNQVGSARRNANTFFRKWGIPLEVKVVATGYHGAGDRRYTVQLLRTDEATPTTSGKQRKQSAGKKKRTTGKKAR